MHRKPIPHSAHILGSDLWGMTSSGIFYLWDILVVSGCLTAWLATHLLLHVCKEDYYNVACKGEYSHSTRIIVKCNPACQNYILKKQYLLEVFTANSGRRGRWRSAENLGPTPISLQAKDPTSQLIIHQPLYLESIFFYLQASMESRFLRQLFR